MEQIITGDEGISLATAIWSDTPLNRPSRHPTGPDDWGDDATAKCFVMRRGKDSSTVGPTDWGQYMGEHEIKGERKPVIVLQRCGWADNIDEIVGDLAKVFVARTPEECSQALRESAVKTPVVGVTVFDTIEDMKATFHLD